jgi:hypothetical protein
MFDRTTQPVMNRWIGVVESNRIGHSTTAAKFVPAFT